MDPTSSFVHPTDSHGQIIFDSSNSTAKGRYKNLQKGDSTLEFSKQFFQIEENNFSKTDLPRSRDQKAVTYDSSPNFAQKKIDEAEKLFISIANLYPIKKEGKQDLLDCHYLSYGTACMMIHHYLKFKKDGASFIIVTGIGHHSQHDELFEMKKRVLEFIKEFHPDVTCKNQSNPGMLYCQKR